MDKREIKISWNIFVERCTECMFMGRGEFTPVCKLDSQHKHITKWYTKDVPNWCPLLKFKSVNVQLSGPIMEEKKSHSQDNK